MRIITLVLALALLFPAMSFAGQINGTLRVNRNPAPQGTNFTIICGGQPYPGGTGPRGSYSVYVRQTGRCTFTVPNYPGAAIDIYSYNDPIRYDFDLFRSGSGYMLRRR